MEKILGEIKVCLYTIIVLLFVLIIILIAVNGDKQVVEESTENLEYDVSSFESIDATEFLNVLNSEEPTVVYLGREGCGYCVNFLPVLKQAQQEMNYKTHYVDIYEVDNSTDDYKTMVSKINDLTEQFNDDNNTNYESIYGYTPMVLIVQDGYIEDVSIGYLEYDKFKEFLNKNGVE